MICPNCRNQTTSLFIDADGTFCHKCKGVAETSGTRLDNTLTRNSFRVTQEQQRYEADMLPPHRYNPVTKQAEPNPDFVDLYADKAKEHYSPEELRKADMGKLATKVEKDLATKHEDKGVKFTGQTKQGIEKAIKNAK